MNEKTVSDFNIEHILKQKKKDLPNGFVYSVVNGKTEMHNLSEVALSDFNDITLGQFLQSLVEQNKILREVNENQNKAILTNKDRIEKLEEIIKRYGLV